MPGTQGYTMACFEAEKVPLGSKVYTEIKLTQEAKDAVAAESPKVEALLQALIKIRDQHRFNVTSLLPSEVHAICFEALTEFGVEN